MRLPNVTHAVSSITFVARMTICVYTPGSLSNIPAPTLPVEMWTDIDARTFRVRGETYMLDKVKTPSAPAMFKLAAVDVFECPEPTQNVCAHPRNRVRSLKSGYIMLSRILYFLCFFVS